MICFVSQVPSKQRARLVRELRRFPQKLRSLLRKIKRLGTSLETLLEEWSGEFLIKSILVSIEYRQIVAKSNRVRRLLKGGIGQEPEATIRGARYLDIDTPRARHVMDSLRA